MASTTPSIDPIAQFQRTYQHIRKIAALLACEQVRACQIASTDPILSRIPRVPSGSLIPTAQGCSSFEEIVTTTQSSASVIIFRTVALLLDMDHRSETAEHIQPVSQWLSSLYNGATKVVRVAGIVDGSFQESFWAFCRSENRVVNFILHDYFILTHDWGEQEGKFTRLSVETTDSVDIWGKSALRFLQFVTTIDREFLAYVKALQSVPLIKDIKYLVATYLSEPLPVLQALPELPTVR